MFGPDTCEGQPEHPELVELSRMEGKQNKKGRNIRGLKV